MTNQYYICFALLFAVVSWTNPSGGCCVASSWKTRNSFQVLRIEVNNTADVKWLLGIQKSLEHEEGADFWRVPNAIGQPVDVMLPEDFAVNFKPKLDTRGMNYSVMIEDVYGLVEDQLQSMKAGIKARWNESEFDYSVYHTYDEIRQWVTDFASEHSDIAEEFVVTTSYEDRDIAGVKLSVSNSQSKKRSVWFEGGIHAREWISPAAVLYLTNQLVKEYKDGNTEIKRILNHLDFYIVPTLNVDGYAHTWKNIVSRLWRKNRSPNPGSSCKGTDGNRNWPYEWGGIRASTDPCDETYRGSGPASEAEMQGVMDFTLKVSKTQHPFALFMDWHSYSQLWLYPWSYSTEAPPTRDEDDQRALADAAVEAMKLVHNTKYTPGPAATTLYAASGYSIDWSYKVLKAKYSYLVELRDQGRYGFLLPENQIIPTGEECYAAVKVVGKRVVDELLAGKL